MADYTFEIEGLHYAARKLDLYEQLDVAAKVTALWVGAQGMFVEIARAGGFAEMLKKPLPDVSMWNPLVREIVAMPDLDRHFIIKTCLRAVSRKVDGDRGWAPIMTQDGASMFDDINGVLAIRLAWEVIRLNLAGFFRLSPSASQGSPQGQSTSL